MTKSTKKKVFDVAVILAIAIALIITLRFDVESIKLQYAFIPLLSLYVLGQYSQKWFSKNSVE